MYNLTFPDCTLQIAKLVHALKKRGVEQGHKVAFVANSDWQVVLLFFALFHIGAIACPLSPRWPNLKDYLDELDADFFFTLEDISFDETPLYLKINPQLPATLLFTSGTTAKPKIVCHTFANHYYSALGINKALNFNSQDKWQLSLPLHHVGGLGILFRCYAANATIASEDANYISMVPTQLLRQKEKSNSCIILGGAPIAKSMKHENVKVSYGLTEMASTVTLDGKVLPYRQVKLADDGEILVKGETLFLGYYTKEKGIIRQEGWFATKDLGKWTDSSLEIIGRKDNQFISGGENIQPEEIEMALLSLGIEYAVVIPIPHAEFGHVPIAFIYPYLEDIQERLQNKLPRFKIPKTIYPLPEPYRVAKPPRHKLKELIK